VKAYALPLAAKIAAIMLRPAAVFLRGCIDISLNSRILDS
jgi:hypothetical protein